MESDSSLSVRASQAISLSRIDQDNASDTLWVNGVDKLTITEKLVYSDTQSGPMQKMLGIFRQKKLRELLGILDDQSTNIVDKIALVANEDSPILLLGESGVGKSHMAKRIHEISDRNKCPFRDLNCAAITPEQLYVQVFGHANKAYTGVGARKSIFELANGGTVFFDEIGYASPFFQQNLLTFLDSKKYDKPGFEKKIEANIRLIFGTNKDLRKLVKKGAFMEDFYARIALRRVFELAPLCKRKNDIPSFAQIRLKFLNDNNSDKGFEYIKFTNDALEQLKVYTWPHNVRQLMGYVDDLYYDAQYAGVATITKKTIQAAPPSEDRLHAVDTIEDLERNIASILKRWAHEKDGKFVDDFLIPIVAKVYTEDLRYAKSKSNDVLGVDGGHGAASPLHDACKRYRSIARE